MIRQKIIDTLHERGPLTLDELSEATGVPSSMLRSALTGEFYRQLEINHPEYGRVTAWAVRPSALRVDPSGHYYVPERVA